MTAADVRDKARRTRERARGYGMTGAAELADIANRAAVLLLMAADRLDQLAEAEAKAGEGGA